MRNKLWIFVAPMMLLGLAACGEDTASNDQSAQPPAANTATPGASSGSTTPPPATGSGSGASQ